MLTEFKRIKHGQQPGDFMKRRKIAMREKKAPFTIWYDEAKQFGTYVGLKCAKSFRNFFKIKSKKRQRRRDSDTIQRELRND